jgi:DNA-directed RNA polymerase subunit L
MVDIEIKMRNAFKLSDLLYFRERDKILFDLEKDLPRISRGFQLSGGLNSSMHVNNILDRRLDAIKQLVNFRIKLDAQKIDETVGIITVEISEKIFERAKQLIKDQMGNFCRRFPGSNSYLDLINSRVKDEKNKLIIYAEREVDIFQKQSESKIQGKKVFNEMSVTEKEIQFSALNAWARIKNEFGVSKITFGRKIYFVKDKFKREIIFRDTLNAYMLAENGFSKSAVILVGSIIEELLRLYLDYKNIHPSKNNFNEYIKLCESKGILKKGISKLSDSVRHFRNIVHLENEISPKYTISKAAAKNAVSSIFVIINDF